LKKYSSFLRESQEISGINFIKFGNPLEEHLEISKRKSEIKNWFLQKGLIETIAFNAPANSSQTTKKDLEYLVQRMNQITSQELMLARAAEENLPQVFIDYFASKGIVETMEDYFRVDTQAEPLLFYIKNLVNRPRPHQISFYYNLPVFPLIPTDACSASFPSGHALSGFVMGEYYARKHPSLGAEVRDLGQRIAESRENVGIHYPSDTEVARAISDVIWKNNLIR